MRMYLKMVLFSVLLLLSAKISCSQERSASRHFWLVEMDKMVGPVLSNLANDQLKENMPKRIPSISDSPEFRIQVQYLEVIGRVFSGIAPWLDLEEGDAYELELREKYRKWVIDGLVNAMDSTANDFLRFDIGNQQLVDASFLALGLLRSNWIWDNLPDETKRRLIDAFKSTRNYTPYFSNWLLFSAVIETFLADKGENWDQMRVNLTINQFEQWYVGDGVYKDGVYFAYDYYNSYVIHPYLTAIVDGLEGKVAGQVLHAESIKKRNARYAVILERLIMADGTYPASGRSIIYRGAAFHHLANMAFLDRLPEELTPASVREALTAVISKTLTHEGTYHKDGWLSIGLHGNQPKLGDSYNNQGSPYLAATVFLPLGLSPSSPFWSDPAEPWTSKRIWSGDQEVVKDSGIR